MGMLAGFADVGCDRFDPRRSLCQISPLPAQLSPTASPEVRAFAIARLMSQPIRVDSVLSVGLALREQS
jgi:hypothetical protein